MTVYDDGYYEEGQYVDGDKVNNSGHLRVAVSPWQVTVDYIRAYLPGDGPNGEVAYSYVIPAPGLQQAFGQAVGHTKCAP